MKKIALLVLSGLFVVTCVTASDRTGKGKQGKQVQKKATSSATAAVVVKEEPSEKPKHGTKRKQPSTTAPKPAPKAMRDIVVSGGSSSDLSSAGLSWEEACATKLSEESLGKIMRSGRAAFQTKQEFLVQYLVEHGFSLLAAAHFVAFDNEDVQRLISDPSTIPDLLTAPGFVPNSADLGLVDFFKNQITPFVFLAMNSRSINDLFKWLVRRIEMFSTLEKGGSGLHAVIISGIPAILEAIIGNAEPAEITAMIEEIGNTAGCPALADCVLQSQSLATVEACITCQIIPAGSSAVHFKLATPAEDFATLQSLGMEQIMGKIDVGGLASSLDISALVGAVDVGSLVDKISSLPAGEFVDKFGLRPLIDKIGSPETLTLILNKLEEAGVLSPTQLMALGAKLTALGTLRAGQAAVGRVGNMLGRGSSKR